MTARSLVSTRARKSDLPNNAPRHKLRSKKTLAALRYAVERLEPRTLLTAVSWISPSSGDFDDPTNWSTGFVPNSGDDVTINVAPSVTVTHSAGNDQVQSLTSNNPFVLSGGTLGIMGNLTLTNTFSMAGGTLAGASITGNPGELTATPTAGSLSGVSVNADISIPDGTALSVNHGIFFNGGNIVLSAAGSPTKLIFSDATTQTLGGTGSIVLGGSAPDQNMVVFDNSTAGITVGAGVTLVGNGGTIVGNTMGGAPLVLNGTILANAPGPGINLTGADWDNEGTLEADTGGTLNLLATVGFHGSIIENNSALTLGGIVVDPSNISRNGGVINFSGQLQLDGGTQTFNTLTGSWFLTGGSVQGSTLVFTGGNSLIPTAMGGTFDNVSLNSDLTIGDGAFINVVNDLTLNSSIININSDGNAAGINFNCPVSQSLLGTGTINFGGTAPNFNFLNLNDDMGVLTVTSNIVIHGAGGKINSNDSAGAPILNGFIIADSPGGVIDLTGGVFDLEGTAEATSGGVLQDDAHLGINGNISETGGTLILNSLYGSINNITRSGGTVNLTGTLDFVGGTATFTTASGSWNLLGGTVRNTTLSFLNGNTLIPTVMGGTFDNVTLNSNLDVANSAIINVVDNLTLNSATLTIEAQSTVSFNEPSAAQAILGTGQIVLNGGTVTTNNNAQISAGLKISPNITVSGTGTLVVGPFDFLQGTISADQAGQPLTITGSSANNQGTFQAINGGILNIDANLAANGIITETNSTINFTGLLNALPSVGQSGGVVNIAGTLDLGGNILTFVTTTGTWQFTGTVQNGEIAFNGGNLVPAGMVPTLSNITLDSDFTVPDGVNMVVGGQLTLNNSTLNLAAGTLGDSVAFSSEVNQAVVGSGIIRFNANSPQLNTLFFDNIQSNITLGPGIVISGGNGTLKGSQFRGSGSSGAVFLQGTITANAGATIDIDGTNFVSQGDMIALGGTINILHDFTEDAVGTLEVLIDQNNPGQFNISGNVALAGTFNVLLTPGFVPPNGSVYNAINFGGESGAFGTINGLNQTGVTFTPSVGAAAFQLTAASGGPQNNIDISVTSLTDMPGTYNVGDTFGGDGTFLFTGNFDSSIVFPAFDYQLFLSPDPVFGNGNDILVQDATMLPPPFPILTGFSIAATIPAVALPGKYFLIAQADTANVIPETNETNNVFISAVNDIVVAPSAPPPNLTTDVFLSDISYTGGTFNTGDSFNVTGTANNTGPGPTVESDIELVLSQDTIFGNRDDIFLQDIALDPTSGAGTTSGPIGAVIPPGIPFGSYHVLVKIDSANLIAETDETNNVYVSPQANVVIPAPVIPPVAQPVKIGSPDPNFGTAGLAAHDVGITATSGVALQSDGKSIIIGTHIMDGSGDFVVTRYTANGGIDSTFGSQGTVTTDFGGDDRATAVFILNDGRILVAGTSARGGGSEFALARYNSDGSLDTTFGSGTGKLLTSFSSDPVNAPSNDTANALAVRGDGVIYLAGSSNAAGHGLDFAIAAYAPDGSLLTPFDGNGKELIDFTAGDDAAKAIDLDSSNNLVIGGSTQTPGSSIVSMALARVKPTGILDKTFAKTGKVTRNLRGIDDEITSVAVTKTTIVAGGFSATGSATDGSLSTDFAVVRYTKTGKADGSFAHGAAITPFGQPSAITRIILLNDGKVVASGKTTGNLSSLVGNQLDVALARYNINGTLDTTFSATGTALLTLQSTSVGSPRALVHPAVGDSLMQKFTELTQSTQGELAISDGGELFDVGTSGTETVEAAIVATGVDLVDHLAAKLGASVIGGTKGSVTIKLTNAGPDNATGPVTINLFASLDTAAGTGDTLLQSIPANVKLKVNQSQTFKINFSFPTSVSGSYFVVTQVSAATLSETNIANNTAATPAVQIGAAAIDLTAGALTATLAKAKLSASFKLTNLGNITAPGTTSVQFLASTDGMLANAQALTTISRIALSIKAGASKSLKESIVLPSTLTAGTYFLLALIDPDNTLNESNQMNNLVVSGVSFVVH